MIIDRFCLVFIIASWPSNIDLRPHRGGDDDDDDDGDPLNGDFCHLHWYFGHLFPMQKSHDSDKSPIMGFLSLGLVLLSLGLVLLSRDKYPTWDFGHLTGVFAS